MLPQVQRCTLLSIKTGGCPETCTYCSQSSSWSKSTGMKAEKLMDLEEVYQVCTVLCFPEPEFNSVMCLRGCQTLADCIKCMTNRQRNVVSIVLS